MNTDKLKGLQSFIGKEFTASPSPFMHWLKPTVVSVELGKLCFQYTVRKEMTNPFGTLHGGVTAAIIDDIIGATLFTLDEPFFHVTINNVVDYFSPAKENDLILAETLIIKNGSQITNVQCTVWNKDKTRMIAKGYSNMLKKEPQIK